MVYSACKLSSPPAEAALCLESRGEHLDGLASKYAGITGNICSHCNLDQHMLYPSSRLHCSVSFASDASLLKDRWAGEVECEG